MSCQAQNVLVGPHAEMSDHGAGSHGESEALTVLVANRRSAQLGGVRQGRNDDVAIGSEVGEAWCKARLRARDGVGAADIPV